MFDMFLRWRDVYAGVKRGCGTLMFGGWGRDRTVDAASPPLQGATAPGAGGVSTASAGLPPAPPTAANTLANALSPPPAQFSSTECKQK